MAFLLDSSESAKNFNHEQQKNFVLEIVDRMKGLQLTSGRTLSWKIALLQYSSTVLIEQTFKDWKGPDAFKSRIAPITHIGHGTYTTYAITNLTQLYMTEGTLGSVKVAVLLTDGVDHPRNPDIFSATADAKHQGIVFFTVGMTRVAEEVANAAKLRLLASVPASSVHCLPYVTVKKEKGVYRVLLVKKVALVMMELLVQRELRGSLDTKEKRAQKVQVVQEDSEGSRVLKGHLEMQGPKECRGQRDLKDHKVFREKEDHQEKVSQVQREIVVLMAQKVLGGNQALASRVRRVKLALLVCLGPLDCPVLEFKERRVIKVCQEKLALLEKGVLENLVQRGNQVLQGWQAYLAFQEKTVHQDKRVNLVLQDVLECPVFQDELLWDQRATVDTQDHLDHSGQREMDFQARQSDLASMPTATMRFAGCLQVLAALGETAGRKPSGFGFPQQCQAIADKFPACSYRMLPCLRDFLGFQEHLGSKALKGLDYLDQRVIQVSEDQLVSQAPQEKAFQGQKVSKEFKEYQGLVELLGKDFLDQRVIVELQVKEEEKERKREDIIKLIKEICGCGIKCKEIPMELVFVIDSSESVGPENFEIIKDFVTALVDRVTVGRNATRIGLVLYSLEVRLEFGLNRYTTQQDVKQAIRKMLYMGEGTYTGTAIRKATQEGFFGARTGVRKVAIVLTDGQADKREAVKLDFAVREAHAANIEMYAIGIVNASDPTQVEFLRELNLIASDPDREHMYLIDDFNTLPGE
uniref:Uncharacterized protein n=1 Tax=Sphaerodactylus townsendi TaxID=933632 RepID=A0ACB8G0X5_9SAUR